MSNIRPWFRLSSIARPTSQGSNDPPPPPPQPKPQPQSQSQPRQTPRRPVIIRTPARQSSPPHQRQPSPPRQRQPPPLTPQQRQPPPSPPRQKTPPPPPRSGGKGRDPSLPLEQSSYHSPPSRHMSPPTPPKAATTPLLPPRLLYTPPASPKEVKEAFQPRTQDSPPSPAHSTRSIKSEWETPRRASSPHGEQLSPYSLPPSRLHSERETTQKNILTAEKISHLHEPNHQNTNNHSQNHNHQSNNTKKSHHQPHFSEYENLMGTRVITIAGENKGAVMEILRSPRSNKTGSGTHSSKVFNGTGEKGRRLQSSSSSSSDEGEGKKKTTKNNKGNNGNLPMRAYTNSNVQMINNSIVYNSTATHHDPGVHLKITKKHGSGLHVKDYGNDGGYTK